MAQLKCLFLATLHPDTTSDDRPELMAWKFLTMSASHGRRTPLQAEISGSTRQTWRKSTTLTGPERCGEPWPSTSECHT